MQKNIHDFHDFVLRYSRAVEQLGKMVDEEFLSVETKGRGALAQLSVAQLQSGMRKKGEDVKIAAKNGVGEDGRSTPDYEMILTS